MKYDECVEALLHCSGDGSPCDKCILYDANDEDCECSRMLKRKAVEIIRRQQALIEALQMDKEQLQSDIVNANMNLDHTVEQLTVMADLCRKRQRLIEELQKYYEDMENSISQFRQDHADVKFLKEKIKAEAIKEFAHYLIDNATNGCVSPSELPDYVVDFINRK